MGMEIDPPHRNIGGIWCFHCICAYWKVYSHTPVLRAKPRAVKHCLWWKNIKEETTQACTKICESRKDAPKGDGWYIKDLLFERSWWLGRLVMTWVRQTSDASSRMARRSWSRGLTDWRTELAGISQSSGNSLYIGRNNLHAGTG